MPQVHLRGVRPQLGLPCACLLVGGLLAAGARDAGASGECRSAVLVEGFSTWELNTIYRAGTGSGHDEFPTFWSPARRTALIWSRLWGNWLIVLSEYLADPAKHPVQRVLSNETKKGIKLLDGQVFAKKAHPGPFDAPGGVWLELLRAGDGARLQRVLPAVTCLSSAVGPAPLRTVRMGGIWFPLPADGSEPHPPRHETPAEAHQLRCADHPDGIRAQFYRYVRDLTLAPNSPQGATNIGAHAVDDIMLSLSRNPEAHWEACPPAALAVALLYCWRSWGMVPPEVWESELRLYARMRKRIEAHDLGRRYGWKSPNPQSQVTYEVFEVRVLQLLQQLQDRVTPWAYREAGCTHTRGAPLDLAGLQARSRTHGSLSFAQYEEDALLEMLFKVVGAGSQRFLEIGTGSGHICNTRYLRAMRGWQGLMFDPGHSNAYINLYRMAVTPQSINNYLEDLWFRISTDRDMALLSILVYGAAFALWASLDPVWKPRVVIVDCSGGASADAFVMLGRRKNYSLVHVGFSSCYFLRDDLLAAPCAPRPVAAPGAGGEGGDDPRFVEKHYVYFGTSARQYIRKAGRASDLPCPPARAPATSTFMHCKAMGSQRL